MSEEHVIEALSPQRNNGSSWISTDDLTFMDEKEPRASYQTIEMTPAPKREPKFCSNCSTLHFPYLCPNYFCTICCTKGHLTSQCPYLRDIPKGADFDQDNYEVLCLGCYALFDTDRWVCSSCPCSYGKLKHK